MITPVKITENSVQVFHRRLANLTATESHETNGYTTAQKILAYEAEARSKMVKLIAQEKTTLTLNRFFRNRPVRSWSWYIGLSERFSSPL